MNVVWATKAMERFARIAADALGWKVLIDCPVTDADNCMVIGMYDPPAYQYTLDMTKGAKRRLIYFCGSDTYGLVRPDLLPEATYLCECSWIAEDLARKGINAHVIQFPTMLMPDVTPLPDEDVVSVYLGSVPARYGESTLMAVAEAMPDVKFKAYMFDTYSPDEMHELIANTKVCLRLVYPDGAAASPREFMCAGRRAVTAVPVEYATRIIPDDIPGIILALKRALRETEPDYEAAAFHRAMNAPERFAADIRGI